MAKSPTLLTPEEAISLAVEWQPSEKNETDNHISVTFFLFSPAPVPERICSPLLLLQYFENQLASDQADGRCDHVDRRCGFDRNR